MVFRKSKLFEMAAKSADGKALNMDQHEISKLNSYVISASIAGKKLTDLKEKVRTIFKPLKVSYSPFVLALFIGFYFRLLKQIKWQR